MKKIESTFIVLLAALSVFWLLAEGFPTSAFSSFASWRGLLYYSGIIAIGAMSGSLILSARWKFLEPYLGGLDKMYRLHKWLGITGLVFSVVHWLSKQAPFWISPPTGPRPPHETPAAQASAILNFFQNMKGPAEGLGNPGFYILILLVILALVKWFPYRYFFKTHRILAVVYLVLAFHSLVLMKFNYWETLLGASTGILLLAGTVAAFTSLFRQIGTSNRAFGKITGLKHHAGVEVVQIDVKLASTWAGHSSGQFAFVTLHEKEGAHPFTISSHWNGDGNLSFLVKNLGDYTAKLPGALKIGADVSVEGPYGEFKFENGKKRQIWIGAGIGITPFVARMTEIAAKPDGRAVDLFHATSVYEESAIAALRKDVEASGVKLHLFADKKNGRIDAEQICAAVPDWSEADIWFCGPSGFAQSLRAGFIAKGLSVDSFHAELFEMR